MRVFKKTKTAKRFTIELRDHLGIARRFSGLTDKRQTEQLGRRIEALVGCRSARVEPNLELTLWLEKAPASLKRRLADVGILEGARVSAARPLRELLEDFTDHLRAKERTEKHVSGNGSMLRRIFTGCRFTVFSDITPGKLERFLKGLRDGGLSVSRSNVYLTSAKAFCSWMRDTGQASENPLRSLKKLNEKTDVRRERRAATPDELRKLLAATAEGPERFGMTGPERALLYRFCAETGLRANEARTLTAGGFDLDNLTVTVKAGYSKHRETDTVPLRQSLAEALSGHLAGKLPTAKVFGGRYARLTEKTAEMLRADLEAAGVCYEDEQGRVLDFHGLRHTYITNLRHAPSRVAQKLARHKSSAMTDRYTHIRMHDERAALDLLPDLTASSQSEAARKTGTDNCPAGAIGENQERESDIRHSGARHGALRGANSRKTLEEGAKPNRVPDTENAVSEWARLDSNQGPTHYECAALTAELRARRRGAGTSRLGGEFTERAGRLQGFSARPQGGHPGDGSGGNSVDFDATAGYM